MQRQNAGKNEKLKKGWNLGWHDKKVSIHIRDLAAIEWETNLGLRLAALDPKHTSWRKISILTCNSTQMQLLKKARKLKMESLREHYTGSGQICVTSCGLAWFEFPIWGWHIQK